MLYTRKGDGGTSGLWGTSMRLPKSAPVYEALGGLDELNSLLGLCRAALRRAGPAVAGVEPLVHNVQEQLFVLAAHLAGASKELAHVQIEELEAAVNRIEQSIERPRGFVVPGSSELSALFDVARAVCRRAERACTATLPTPLSPTSLAYLNRLSSLLYALARWSAALEGRAEYPPKY